jgi:hypothetical protein
MVPLPVAAKYKEILYFTPHIRFAHVILHVCEECANCKKQYNIYKK